MEFYFMGVGSKQQEGEPGLKEGRRANLKMGLQGG